MLEPVTGHTRETSISRRLFRWHLLAYILIIGSLLAVNIAGGGRWWSFWPMFGWGVILSAHFFFVRSTEVDDRWVDGRVGELRERSYDFDHIRDIERRKDAGDASVTPHADRET